jgi:hypothetical protein
MARIQHACRQRIMHLPQCWSVVHCQWGTTQTSGCGRHLHRPGEACCSPPAVCACSLRVCMFSGNFLRAAQPVYMFCLAWSNFPAAGALYLGLSYDISLHPCLHHVIVVNSEVAASVRTCALQIAYMHPIIVPSCFALPANVYNINCIHDLPLYCFRAFHSLSDTFCVHLFKDVMCRLRFLIYIYI